MTSLELTEDMLAAAYELMLETHPLCDWNLPPATEIKFVILDTTKDYGRCWTSWRKRKYQDSLRFKIGISKQTVHSLDRLLRVMAHEMIHVYEGLSSNSGAEQTRRGKHSKLFYDCQDAICAALGWDNPLT